MQGVEKIYNKNQLVAIAFRSNIKVNGVKFMTDELNAFQIGMHNRLKGTKLTPHFHKISKPITINTIQELLYVITGKIRVSLYDSRGKIISKKILQKGDSILLITQAHGVDFLEASKIFEIKQGPYPGAQNAKIFFDGKY